MTAKTPSAPPEEDPLITRYVEEALALVRGRLPPDAVEVYRQRLYLFYEEDPLATELLNEIRDAERQRAAVTESGDVPRRDDEALAEAMQRKPKRARGKAR